MNSANAGTTHSDDVSSSTAPAPAPAPTAGRTSSPRTVELNGANVIEESERKGSPRHLFWPWFASNVSVFGISYGSFLLGFGVSFWQAIVVGIVGIAISFFLCGVIALAGKRGNAPTMTLGRAAFGVNGNKVPSILAWVLTVGWETVLTSLAVLATATIFKAVGWNGGAATKITALLVVAGLIVAGGVLGFDFIMKLQKYITIVTGVLTVVYFILVVHTIDWTAISELPAGRSPAVIGGFVFMMTGFGLGWVISAADYSRYLPRKSSSGGVVWWTTFGSSLAPVLLLLFGLLLAGSSKSLSAAMGDDPSIDGALMVIGSVYVVFFATSFVGPFQGFLITLGVPVAAWAGIFLADVQMRRKDYSTGDLFDTRGRYGNIRWVALGLIGLGTVVGWGLVTNTFAVWLSWQGYLLGPLGLGGRTGAWAFANVGVLAALAIGYAGTIALQRGSIRRQESLVSNHGAS
ncbi:MAG: allantoin permease [Frondihabitans sp.]|nr:allantoin permease [Frondihabitans sp.]